jgi:hypothetical protein
MTNTPERYDHHEDGMEIARDGDFVSYDDYAALLSRAEQAEARVKELEGAVRLLSSMVVSGEGHTKKSVAIVEAALTREEPKAMTAPELKPCPFCGRAPRMTDNGEYCPDYEAGVICDCGACVFDQYRSFGVATWNARTDISQAAIAAALAERERQVWNEALEQAAQIVDPAPNAKSGRWAENIRRKAAAIRAMKQGGE